MSEKIREEFEAWDRATFGSDTEEQAKDERGEYEDSVMQQCWMAWKASRESLVIELPAKDKNRVFRDFFGRGMEFGIDQCREILNAIGLKVKP